METVAREATCGNCGLPIDLSKDKPHEGREPCACGSTTRQYQLRSNVEIKAEVHLKTTTRKRLFGTKKPYLEVTEGDSFTWLTKTWSRIRQVIDRKNNWYEKTVTDVEGKIIRHQAQPLKEHQGYGSAKFKKR